MQVADKNCIFVITAALCTLEKADPCLTFIERAFRVFAEKEMEECGVLHEQN